MARRGWHRGTRWRSAAALRSNTANAFSAPCQARKKRWRRSQQGLFLLRLGSGFALRSSRLIVIQPALQQRHRRDKVVVQLQQQVDVVQVLLATKAVRQVVAW